MDSDRLNKILANLPERTGVYIYRNAAGTVIYVGKATSLKSRVKQYFSASGDGRATVESMVPQIEDIDFVVTANVQEALLLECNLIKQYMPKYNILLKDNKTYPYICVTVSEPFPRVFSTRTLNGKDLFFGPYSSAGDVRQAIVALRKAFPFRTCRKPIDGGKLAQRPCLFYGFGECTAPCCGYISREDYQKNIDKVIQFLKGHEKGVLDQLNDEMMKASESLEFEKAAAIRNRIYALKSLIQKQQVFRFDNKNRDVLAAASSVNNTFMVLLSLREGKLLNAVDFVVKKQPKDTPESVFSSYMMQHYMECTDIPEEIVTEVMPEYAEEIQQLLTQKRGKAVSIICPVRGEKKQLVLMAKKNAVEKLNADTDKRQSATLQLKELLGLKKEPKRIEGYDISTLQGTNTVSSMVVFEDGKPKKSDYRRYRIKTVVGTTDDFRSMNETLTRRFSHLGEDEERFGKKPDLILIDGGKGQLHAAYDAMLRCGVEDVEMISLAKREEEVFTLYSGEPVVLSKDSEALKLLQRVRDESHRFAVTYHTLLRGKSSLISIVEDIPGIGPKKRRLLMQKFRTVDDIRNASVEDIMEVKGINRALAESIKEYIG